MLMAGQSTIDTRAPRAANPWGSAAVPVPQHLPALSTGASPFIRRGQ